MPHSSTNASTSSPSPVGSRRTRPADVVVVAVQREEPAHVDAEHGRADRRPAAPAPAPRRRGRAAPAASPGARAGRGTRRRGCPSPACCPGRTAPGRAPGGSALVSSRSRPFIAVRARSSDLRPATSQARLAADSRVQEQMRVRRLPQDRTRAILGDRAEQRLRRPPPPCAPRARCQDPLRRQQRRDRHGDGVRRHLVQTAEMALAHLLAPRALVQLDDLTQTGSSKSA